MNITSAVFVKGAVGPDERFEDGTPQVAFVGRSNVGKSSIINSLLGKKELARTSSFPGHTLQLNIFHINKSLYFVDLPGYGFAKASQVEQRKILKMIFWYLFESGYQQKKVALLLDAVVGPTEPDLNMLRGLEESHKDIIIVANKIDKIKKSQQSKHLQKIKNAVGHHKIIPYSSEKGIGVTELRNELI